MVIRNLKILPLSPGRRQCLFLPQWTLGQKLDPPISYFHNQFAVGYLKNPIIYIFYVKHIRCLFYKHKIEDEDIELNLAYLSKIKDGNMDDLFNTVKQCFIVKFIGS